MINSYKQLPELKLDGAWRSDMQGARVVIGRNTNGFEELKLLTHYALALYADFTSSELETVLRQFTVWSEKQPESLILYGEFTGAGLQEQTLDSLEKQLDELLAYCRKFAGLLQEAGLLQAVNSPYVVAAIPVTRELRLQATSQAKLLQLVEYSTTLPVRLLFIAESRAALTTACQKSLSWEAYLGVRQLSNFRDRYQELYSEEESVWQEGLPRRAELGVIVSGTRVQVINELNFKPSLKVAEELELAAVESKKYEDFLKELNDGTA